MGNPTWHTGRRYYVVEVIQDLFGTWAVESSWGSLQSRADNSKHVPAQSYEDALSQLERVSKTRGVVPERCDEIVSSEN